MVHAAALGMAREVYVRWHVCGEVCLTTCWCCTRTLRCGSFSRATRCAINAMICAAAWGEVHRMLASCMGESSLLVLHTDAALRLFQSRVHCPGTHAREQPSAVVWGGSVCAALCCSVRCRPVVQLFSGREM